MVGEEMAVDWLFWWLFVGIVASVQAIALIVVFWLIKVGGLNKLLWFRLRGGSLVVHGDLDNSIEFRLAKKPRAVEKFESMDERGEKQMLPTVTKEIKHHLKGSSKPVHICITGQSENLNLLQKFKSDRSAEQWNQWGKGLYQTGILVGSALKEEDKGWFKWDAGTIFSILSICLLLAVAAMQFITLNNLQPPTG